MVFALLFISTKGLEPTEHPSVGKKFIKLWLFYRMEYCVAIKNDVDKSCYKNHAHAVVSNYNSRLENTSHLLEGV